MTSRFYDHCLDYLPVDLNSLLLKYEKDLSAIYEILGNRAKERHYRQLAKNRKKKISRLMWSKKKGFFFDHNYTLKKQSSFFSLAGFYPLWAGLASAQQAKRCRDNLKRFECQHGLANTQKTGLSREFKQWDYPNGWPNQQWIVIKGLLDYGFAEDAERLAIKWLDLNTKVFNKTGKFWEKYDVVAGTVGKEGRYPNQVGFGWTNAVYLKIAAMVDKARS
jgi:alpha,alpha-trehalase